MNLSFTKLDRNEAMALNRARFSFPGKTEYPEDEHMRESIVDALSGELEHPIQVFSRFTIPQLIDYLMRSHALYGNKLLMELDHTWLQLLRSQDETGVMVLYSIFREFMSELILHFREEEQDFFPYALAISGIAQRTSLEYPDIDISSGKEFLDSHDDPTHTLKQVMHGFRDLIRAQGVRCPLADRLMKRLKVLDVDLSIHGLVEEKVLVPKVIQCEKRLSN